MFSTAWSIPAGRSWDAEVIEASGDLWQRHAAGDVVAITTGGLVGKSGACAMPAGCAGQAKKKFPGLDRVLGGLINTHGNHVFDLGNRVVSFPVEETPFVVPDLKLIEQSCLELLELADQKQWQRIVVPRPGCGIGGLDWRLVRPLLEKYFDDRFVIIQKGES